MQTRSHEINVSLPKGVVTVSALSALPPAARGLLVLAHGAGAGMHHAFLKDVAAALYARKIGTLRYQFPFMEKAAPGNGFTRTDSPATAVATVAAAVQLAQILAPDTPLFAGGKSFGGRMTTTAAAEEKLGPVRGLICFGFPLHPAKKPDTKRAEHLSDVRLPILFLQGTRDDLADLKLMKEVASELGSIAQLHIVEGADHSFATLKSSGRSAAQVFDELADAVDAFVSSLTPLDLSPRTFSPLRANDS